MQTELQVHHLENASKIEVEDLGNPAMKMIVLTEAIVCRKRCDYLC